MRQLAQFTNTNDRLNRRRGIDNIHAYKLNRNLGVDNLQVSKLFGDEMSSIFRKLTCQNLNLCL